MPDNVQDAPAPVQDKAPVEEQQDQESWVSKVFKAIAKESSAKSAPYEGLRMPAPAMLSMERSGSLPVCRTSC